MKELIGWLFDLYVHPQKGIVLWLIDEDGKAHCLHKDLEITFYAGGPFPRLRELWRFLIGRQVKLERVTREDLFDGPQEVMKIHVASPTIYQGLFREVYQRFPDLTYYDVDVPLTVRYAATYNVFMMARCAATIEDNGKLTDIRALDMPEELDPKLPRLRILSLRPDTDPSHEPPKYLIAKFGKSFVRIPFDKPQQIIAIVNSILVSFDPDVIQTHFGDVWLLPYMEKLSKETKISFNPNRDTSLPVLRKKETSFFNYGQAHYRAPQIHLRGRWHVDIENCMTYNQYHLAGAIEQVRLSSLPLQEVARRSPGAAIAAMQDLVAIRRGILVPYQHQKGEIPKTFNELIRADRGGLVFQPVPGIYQNVAILDFSSKMASIMIEFNVSPETVVMEEKADFKIPDLGIGIASRLGLVPETLKPMRDKRLALKLKLRTLNKDDPEYHKIRNRLKPVIDGIKWLTVVCYGRLGFANSCFGRINAHEAVSYLSRKVITKAKLLAEERGFDVLHLYVDSLFVSKTGASAEDFKALAKEIERETHLPMDFDGVIYPWFAFLSARANPNLGVANRFFGLSPDGEHKIRGIALRRGDTPLFAAKIQVDILNILAKETDPAKLATLLPEVLELVRERLTVLKKREVPLEELVVTQTLSRELDKYSVLSPPAIAASQLQAQGKILQRGQRVRYIYTAQGPGVFAWDLPTPLDQRAIDVHQYNKLILLAVYDVLGPLGVSETILKDWLFGQASYITPISFKNFAKAPHKLSIPLFAELDHLRVDRI